MNKRTESCFECRGRMTITAGQVVCSGDLCWFRSYRCEDCGFALEEDGEGIDGEIHADLLKAEG